MNGRCSVLWTVLFLTGAVSFADNVEVVDAQGGQMTWTTDAANAISVYTVEWASSITSGAWRSSWSSLEGITTTNQVITVEVPMFYRVTGYSYKEETNAATLRQMYINAVLDASNVTPQKISRNLLAVHPDFDSDSRSTGPGMTCCRSAGSCCS